MSIRKEEFINGEIYHITIRGVEGREIFIDDDDRWRGIFSLYEFNNSKSVSIRNRRKKRQTFKKNLEKYRGLASVASGVSIPEIETDLREKMVEIFAFVFMPNHLHLLLKQATLNGISNFMQKFGSGYSGYFNRRHQRKGHLFQDKFRASHIAGDNYLKTVFVYIHTNPVALVQSNWKNELIKKPAEAKQFLEGYRWSSYLDYIGKKNFPSVTDRDFVLKIFGSNEAIKQHINRWVDHRTKFISSPSDTN